MSLEQTGLWQNKEWRVTREGLERVSEEPRLEHQIAKDDLSLGSSDVYSSWPVQCAQNGWADLDGFVKAYLTACVIHGVRVENVHQIVMTARKTRLERLHIT